YADRVPLYSLAAYALSLGLTIVFLSLTQVLSTPISLPAVTVELLPSQFAFGLVLTAEERKFAPLVTGVICEPLKPAESGRKTFDRKRRLFIKAGVTTGIAAVLLYYGVNLLFPPPRTGQSNSSSITQSGQSVLSSQEVTPTDKFYRVD